MRRPTLFARLVGLWCLGALASCTDPYLPDAIKSPPSYLVVDGFINTQGVSTINLTRAYAIASAGAPPVETQATLYIEDEAGGRNVLQEGVKGTYTSAALVLSPAKKYRLRLRTQAGKEFASDFVAAKTTPPIDNVRWRVEKSELNILVNAHDDTNTTKYYRWETAETWEIHSPYQPNVEYVNRVMRSIRVPYPTVCWGNAASSTILINKTTALSQDVVADFRVKVLAASSERFSTRYSILVRQHALGKEEYEYWELQRKNTESIGTLFDPQPVQLSGNVHALSNTGEVVLGYVGAHSVTEKRIFIAHTELPDPRAVRTGYEACIPPDSIFVPTRGVFPPPPPQEVLDAAFGQPQYLPISDFRTSKGGGFLGQSRDCIDCRTRGTSVKPGFW
ncbi:hypothetical protein GCM10027511_41090 [Hymenobacter humi]